MRGAQAHRLQLLAHLQGITGKSRGEFAKFRKNSVLVILNV